MRPAIPAVESNYIGNQSTVHGQSISGPQPIGPHDAWWDQFSDPRLVALLKMAVKNNQSLAETYARVIESRTRYDLSVIGPWPQVDANGSYSRRNQRNPGFLTGVSANGGSAFDAFSSGLAASWELDLWGRLRRTIESQDAQWGATVDQLRDALVTVLADVATNYVELRVVQQRLQIARQNVDVQQRSLKIAEQRFKAGLVSALDGRQAESSLRTTQATIPELEELLQVRINRICTLIGEPPNNEMKQWLANGRIPQPGQPIRTGIPAQLVSQRPDVRAAEKQMHSACAEIGVATAALYPQFNLVGDLGFDSLSLSDLFANQAFFSIGPSIRWNLLTLGRNRRNIEIREAQKLQAVYRFRQTVLSAVEEVENGLIGLQKRQERDRYLRQSAVAARDAYGLSVSAYKIGNSTFQRVLEAQRQLLTAQDAYIRNKGDVAISTIGTYRALGAGWRSLKCIPAEAIPDHDESERQGIEFIPRPEKTPVDSNDYQSPDNVLAPLDSSQNSHDETVKRKSNGPNAGQGRDDMLAKDANAQGDKRETNNRPVKMWELSGDGMPSGNPDAKIGANMPVEVETGERVLMKNLQSEGSSGWSHPMASDESGVMPGHVEDLPEMDSSMDPDIDEAIQMPTYDDSTIGSATGSAGANNSMNPGRAMDMDSTLGPSFPSLGPGHSMELSGEEPLYQSDEQTRFDSLPLPLQAQPQIDSLAPTSPGLMMSPDLVDSLNQSLVSPYSTAHAPEPFDAEAAYPHMNSPMEIPNPDSVRSESGSTAPGIQPTPQITPGNSGNSGSERIRILDIEPIGIEPIETNGMPNQSGVREEILGPTVNSSPGLSGPSLTIGPQLDQRTPAVSIHGPTIKSISLSNPKVQNTATTQPIQTPQTNLKSATDAIYRTEKPSAPDAVLNSLKLP